MELWATVTHFKMLIRHVLIAHIFCNILTWQSILLLFFLFSFGMTFVTSRAIVLVDSCITDDNEWLYQFRIYGMHIARIVDVMSSAQITKKTLSDAQISIPK